MGTVRDASARRKPASATGHLHPAIAAALAPLVDLLLPALRARIDGENGAAAKGPAVDWLDQRSSPLGRRAHCRACASGDIPGARKVGRRWLARRSDLDAYIAAHGRPADAPAGATTPGTSSAPLAPANDTGEPSAAEVEAELRLVGHTRTARGRRALG